jgi:hypothetical protein
MTFTKAMAPFHQQVDGAFFFRKHVKGGHEVFLPADNLSYSRSMKFNIQRRIEK